MDGMFRYGKSIAAALILAAVSCIANYGPHWVFPNADPLPGQNASAVSVNSLHVHRAKSPLRQNVHSATIWKVAVVSNRSSGQRAVLPKPFRATRPLSRQVADSIYETAETDYQFVDVSLPNDRQRGTCPVNQNDPSAIRVSQSEEPTLREFFQRLKTLGQQSETKDVLVFVHGFNVSLRDAAARAAQVAEDMPFAGTVVAFSWNSQALPLAYQQDEHVAERHFWSLAELLHGLRKHLDASCRIHLLAHSMGNRVTLRAINALAGTIDPVGQPTDMFVAARLKSVESVRDAFPAADSGQRGLLYAMNEIPERFPIWASWRKKEITTPPLANLILAAPDVGVEEFSRLVRNSRHVSDAVTVYASNTDLALEASRRVHGGEFRAGDSRATLDVEDAHVVHVSAPSAEDPLGHSYYGTFPKVLDQLHQLTRNPERIVFGNHDIPRLR